MGHWELGIGHWGQGERLVSSSHLLSPCPLVLLPPALYIGGLLYLATRLAKSGKSIGLEI